MCACVSVPKILDRPKKIGDKSRTLVSLITCSNWELSKPGKSIGLNVGTKKNATPLVITINRKKNKKILPINFLEASLLSSIFCIKNGIRTEIETIEPTVMKIKSGILKAA